VTSHLDHDSEPAYSPAEDVEEPDTTLRDAIAEYGISTVLKALARVLTRERSALRREGELQAAKAVRRVAAACMGHAEDLSDEGV
jgi:hypothetical protein